MPAPITFKSYIEWFPTLFPSWLRKKWGQRLAQTLGILVEGMSVSVWSAITARFIKIAPVDALQYIGEERGFFKFPNESDESFRQRLLGAWDQWELSGTPAGIVAGLAFAGYTAIVHESKKDVDVRPNTWDRPDHNPARWASFWVEIQQPHDFGTTNWHVGDGTVIGPDVVVGFNGSAKVVRPKLKLIARIIRKWKASHARCEQIVIVFSGKIVGDFVLGDGTVVGGEARYVSPNIDLEAA